MDTHIRFPVSKMLDDTLPCCIYRASLKYICSLRCFLIRPNSPRIVAIPINSEKGYVFDRSLVALSNLNQVIWTLPQSQFSSRHCINTHTRISEQKASLSALWVHFTYPLTMADSTERKKNQQEAHSSSRPRIEPDAANEAPSSDPSSHHGQSWFRQLKHWSPSLVLENTGSVGRAISSAETESRRQRQDWI